MFKWFDTWSDWFILVVFVISMFDHKSLSETWLWSEWVKIIKAVGSAFGVIRHLAMLDLLKHERFKRIYRCLYRRFLFFFGRSNQLKESCVLRNIYALFSSPRRGEFGCCRMRWDFLRPRKRLMRGVPTAVATVESRGVQFGWGKWRQISGFILDING